MITPTWEKAGGATKKNAAFISSGQFSSVTQLCLTFCDPTDCSTPGLPVHHQLPEFTQTHVHWVGDAIQPSHPLSSPSPPTFNLSQHQGLASTEVKIEWLYLHSTSTLPDVEVYTSTFCNESALTLVYTPPLTLNLIMENFPLSVLFKYRLYYSTWINFNFEVKIWSQKTSMDFFKSTTPGCIGWRWSLVQRGDKSDSLFINN